MPAPARLPRLLNKPRFFEDLGYEPHPGQAEVHRSAAPRRIVACGVRWGKTMCAAMEGLAAAMEPMERSIGWVVAPTYDLADRVFREIVFTAVGKFKHRVVSLRESERKLVLRNLAGGLSEIRAKSADNPVSLLGEGLNWLIVDEASRLKPTIWQAHLSQRLIDKQGWALLISTPKGKGYFFDLFRVGQKADGFHQSWNYPSWSNPLLNQGLIEAERARLPERVFAQEFGAEFVEGAGAVFRKVREAATGDWLEASSFGYGYGGLDLAKIEDFTVLTLVTRGGQVAFVDRFHRLDWDLQITRLKASSERYRPAQVFCDTTGKGEPVFEALQKSGFSASPYPFTSASKAALINNLALLLEKRRLVLPRAELWPEGIDELESFEYSVSDAGNVKMAAPSGSHDDCVISLALAVWGLRERQSMVLQGRFEKRWA